MTREDARVLQDIISPVYIVPKQQASFQHLCQGEESRTSTRRETDREGGGVTRMLCIRRYYLSSMFRRTTQIQASVTDARPATPMGWYEFKSI